MAEIVRSIDFDASIETAFDTICDFEAYPMFLETMKSAKVLEQDEQKAVVEFSVELFKRFSYAINVTIKKPTYYMKWTLVKPDLMKKNDGSWQLTKVGPQSTHAVYTIDVDFDFWVPEPIKKFLVESSVPATLNSFKAEIEKRASTTKKSSKSKTGKKK